MTELEWQLRELDVIAAEEMMLEYEENEDIMAELEEIEQ